MPDQRDYIEGTCTCGTPYKVIIDPEPVVTRTAPPAKEPMGTSTRQSVVFYCEGCRKDKEISYSDPGHKDRIIRDATAEDLEWLKYHDEQTKKTGEYFITSAEKYADIFTAINAIYIGLLAFIGITNNGVLSTIPSLLSVVFLFPIVAWIVGMYFFIQVKQPFFTTYSPESPSAIRQAVMASNIAKGEQYQKGVICFGIGVLLILVPLVLGLYISSASASPVAPSQVEMVIGDNYVQYLQQVPVAFVPGTNKTAPVTLADTTSADYLIILENGDRVAVNRTWVKILVMK